LQELKDQSQTKLAQYDIERAALSKVQKIKEQIEAVGHKIERYERDYDLDRVAQLRHGSLPDLQDKLLPPMSKNLTIGYLRVSSQSQVDDGESLKRQREQIESYCSLKSLPSGNRPQKTSRR
jgi:hypothetical protein